MIIETEGYHFDFIDALNVFKFDETDKTKALYHGVTALKAVDLIAEFENFDVYIEIKDYFTYEEYKTPEKKSENEHFNWLKKYLKNKLRDSFIYRCMENKTEKPIYYLCLINFDNALNIRLAKSLKTELPVGKPSPRWKREFVKSCYVVNLEAWNRNFPKWPVKKLAK